MQIDLCCASVLERIDRYKVHLNKKNAIGIAYYSNQLYQIFLHNFIQKDKPHFENSSVVLGHLINQKIDVTEKGNNINFIEQYHQISNVGKREGVRGSIWFHPVISEKMTIIKISEIRLFRNISNYTTYIKRETIQK